MTTTRRDPKFPLAWVLAGGFLAASACGPTLMTASGGGVHDAGSSSGTGGGSGGGTGGGAGAIDSGKPDASYIDPDAFWATDPPPRWCGPDGGAPAPTPPGGTPDCPDDKNRQGCPCATLGETAPCWPGLRANRNLGVCHDGVTTCVKADELSQVWGECQGYVAPTPGVTKGPAACHCFSAGRWALANLLPCFIMSGGAVTDAVSTWIDSSGKAQCPNPVNTPVTPQPGTTFTTDTLNIDCSGHFTLCYELKAGNAASPQPSDCSMVKVCTEGDYTTPGQAQAFPELPAWTTTNPSCAAQFANSGGYGEMSVKGKSVRCDEVDDGSGGFLVFNRVQYCSLACNTNPTLPGCASCGQGGGGSF